MLRSMREAAPHPATGRGDPARPRRRLGGATRRVRDAGSAGRPDAPHRGTAVGRAVPRRTAPGATAISTIFEPRTVRSETPPQKYIKDLFDELRVHLIARELPRFTDDALQDLRHVRIFDKAEQVHLDGEECLRGVVDNFLVVQSVKRLQQCVVNRIDSGATRLLSPVDHAHLRASCCARRPLAKRW